MDEHAIIRNVIASYAQLFDDRQAQEFADLFADDADWFVPNSTVHGRDAICDFVKSIGPPRNPPVKHLVTDSIIDITGDLATAVSTYTVVAHTAGGGVVTQSGRYFDHLRKHDGRWLFTSKRIQGGAWTGA